MLTQVRPIGVKSFQISASAQGALPLLRLPQHRVELFLHHLVPDSKLREDARRTPFVLAQEAKEQMLRGDVKMSPANGLIARDLDAALGVRRERDCRGLDLGWKTLQRLLNGLLEILCVRVAPLDGLYGNAVRLEQDSMEQVFRADEIVSALLRFFASGKEDLFGLFGELDSHRDSVRSSVFLKHHQGETGTIARGTRLTSDRTFL